MLFTHLEKISIFLFLIIQCQCVSIRTISSFNIMIQRHYSPDEITTLNHSLQKQITSKLREQGSTSNLLSTRTAISFKEQIETIGHYYYRKKDEIGSGYTSHVYKCKSKEKEGDFAVKVIEMKKYSVSSLQMLDNQIQILKKLNHPNIIKFQNVYKSATHCYLITEYCSHGDLLEYMTNNGKLCEKEAIFIISQIIQATKYMLRMGVIHRDIKPANIFKHAKTWKLGDFGFSINSTTEVKTRHNVGTPLYMPIQSLMRNVYSPQSDIFAVGVILYEMMIGVTPWQCRSQKQLLRKMATTPFLVPQKFKISSHIKFLIGKLCAVNKEDRMNKEEFLQLNINNFNSLINFNSESLKNSETQRKGRLFSVGKYVKQQPAKPKGTQKQYLTNRPKSKNQQKSVPKLQRKISSKNKIVDAKTYGSNSRRSSSKSFQKKLDSKLQQKNCEVLTCQLNYCRFMYYIIENYNYLPLNTLNKGRICLVLFKHILKIIKQLSDGKNNWFGFSNWDSFRKSGKYQELHRTLKQYCEKYEKQYLAFLKKAQINVIKEVNQKLPEFSTNEQISIPFYQKILNLLTPLLKQCIQDLSIGKSQDGKARYEGLRSLYKYYRLNEMSIKEYQNYTYFFMNSQITIIKNYRIADLNMNQYMQTKQQIKKL